MQPSFNRETIVDRRQPALRWSAVLAGSAIAVATWLLLQLFGSGIALSVLDLRDWNRIHQIGIGSSAWSVIALVGALFIGGMMAGRLSGFYDRKTVGTHGLLVWAITAIVGLVAISSSISMMTPGMFNMDPHLTNLEYRGWVIDVANTTGCAMLIASLGLALGAVAAIGGALTVAHKTMQGRKHDTLVGHTTAPYPVPPVDPTDR